MLGAVVCVILSMIIVETSLWYYIGANALFILSRIESLHEKLDNFNKK